MSRPHLAAPLEWIVTFSYLAMSLIVYVSTLVCRQDQLLLNSASIQYPIHNHLLLFMVILNSCIALLFVTRLVRLTRELGPCGEWFSAVACLSLIYLVDKLHVYSIVSIWGDESLQYTGVIESKDVIWGSVQDLHPPLGSLNLTGIVNLLEPSLFSMKLYSMLCHWAAVVLFFTFVFYLIRGLKLSFLLALTFLFFPPFYAQSLESRNLAQMGFCATLLLASGTLLLCRPYFHSYLLFGLSSVLVIMSAGYQTYVALPALLAASLFFVPTTLSIKSRFLTFAFANLASYLALAPFLHSHLLHSAQTGRFKPQALTRVADFLNTFDWNSLSDIYIASSNLNYFWYLILALLCLASVHQILSRQFSNLLLACLIFATGFLLYSIFILRVNWLLQPRYVIIFFYLLFFGCAVFVTSCKRHIWILTTLVSLMAFESFAHRRDSYTSAEGYGGNWKSVFQDSYSAINPSDSIILMLSRETPSGGQAVMSPLPRLLLSEGYRNFPVLDPAKYIGTSPLMGAPYAIDFLDESILNKKVYYLWNPHTYTSWHQTFFYELTSSNEIKVDDLGSCKLLSLKNPGNHTLIERQILFFQAFNQLIKHAPWRFRTHLELALLFNRNGEFKKSDFHFRQVESFTEVKNERAKDPYFELRLSTIKDFIKMERQSLLSQSRRGQAPRHPSQSAGNNPKLLAGSPQ